MEGIIINQRFCGPPQSGNGGYVCGLLAGFINSEVEVRLKRPAPLDRPLHVERSDDRRIFLRDGDDMIAEAMPANLELDVPQPPSFLEAQEATSRYLGFDHHVFPTCFVCGPQRDEGDGLCLYPGAITGRNLVAAPWIPHESLGDERRKVKPEFLWAALDCPGAFAVADERMRHVVLGTLAARIERQVAVGERCVVIGWKIGAEGRKYFAGTAVFSASGGLCAKGKAVWIEIEPPV
jgi:hypothetical protein